MTRIYPIIEAPMMVNYGISLAFLCKKEVAGTSDLSLPVFFCAVGIGLFSRLSGGKMQDYVKFSKFFLPRPRCLVMTNP
jgi:hypothetical protein